MEFEQVIEKFKYGVRIVTYLVGEDGKRGEPLKSWEPTVPELVRINETVEKNPQRRAIFKQAKSSGK